MNAAEMIDRLMRHAIRTEMGMQMQMGFPFFRVQDGQLRARFYPHREELAGSGIRLYAAAFRAEWVYPFRHLCSFENRVLSGAEGAGALRRAVDADAYLREYARWAERLGAQSDRILRAAGDGAPAAQLMEEYASALGKALSALKLEDVYPLEDEGIALYRRI